MHKADARWLLLLLVAGLLATTVIHAEEEIPDPISLEQALDYAGKHPRAQLPAESVRQYPLRQPLYLDCHNLAYNNNASNDTQRDRSIDTLIAPLQAQQLEIMRRFFDVLLADSSAVRDNENMAVYFIPLDRTRTRMELGEFSELDVAELDAEYQVVRQQTTASSASQRLTRSMLAQALNNPTQLPRDLNPPRIAQLLTPDQLPALDELFAHSLKNNEWLADRLDDLNKGERTLLEMDLRQSLLELLLRLNIYRVAAERAESEMLWRDYYLERSRTLYQQEVRSDIGDAMTQQSRARLQQQQVRFCHALALAQLGALQGQAVWPPPEPAPEKEQPE